MNDEQVVAIIAAILKAGDDISSTIYNSRPDSNDDTSYLTNEQALDKAWALLSEARKG